jgi:class 3 adenylate cyclase/tetratricopeptide (TPR) repeat protein
MAPVIDCPSCGTPNAPDARFCNSCGQSLIARVATQERRVVTALFADLARSTSLGERLDPEVVRGMVGRFFEVARIAIERYGGTVEKFSGDAVMAVFGLPLAHEDDPERAVRTAIAIRDATALLAADTQARHGVALQARIGIESGEVVVGDPFGGATMATGDAMNVAARLEQQADPGEIVIGGVVWDQVRDLVAAEPLGDVALLGREETLAAWRVKSIAGEVGRPRGVPGLEAPLTGRDEELALLLDAARRAKQARKATLFTILGVPGVGKSRLVREATSRLAQGGWSVVRGRCLPYGEGITYWPVAEMLRDLAGIAPNTSPDDARTALARISPDSETADQLATALGSGSASQAGTAATDRDVRGAFRRLVEHLATHAPQVLVFDDIHWAEPPLLDLIEYLAQWTRDAPLLVVCPARSELLDLRPAWGAGHLESSRIQLEPLTEEESRALLSALLTVDDLPAALHQRVLDRAEGNPLFVEEVVRLLIEEGLVERKSGRWHARAGAADVRVPDSVEALIRARLDTLPARERSILQAASVVGRVFQQSAVAALITAGDGGPIEGHLDDAVLRDLITEERSPDHEPTFRFKHVLIRDVAYGTLPKAHRAELHGQVAAWLRDWAAARIDEFVEIEAYHLEQAAVLHRELDGRSDPTVSQRAMTALAVSGDKALARDDARAGLAFAERALALDPEPGEQRLELEAMKVEALRRLGEWRAVGDLARKVELDAQALARPDIEGRAILAKAADMWLRLDSADERGAMHELERARQLLAAAGDDFYLCSVLNWLGQGGFWEGDLGAAETFWQQALDVARSNGWPSQEAHGLRRLARLRRETGDIDGARQLLLDARLRAERSGSRLVQAAIEGSRGNLIQLTESLDDAEEIIRAVTSTFEEFGSRDLIHGALVSLGQIEMMRDRPREALAMFRRSLGPVVEHAGYLAETQRYIAQALLDLGEVTEAIGIAEQAYRQTAADDQTTIATSSMVLGLARAAEGRFDEAEQLTRAALATMESTDYNPWEQQLALAEFLLRQGRTADGQEMLTKATASASRYGPHSPLIEFVQRRGARAAAAGAAEPNA